jgi:hypothetical protein
MRSHSLVSGVSVLMVVIGAFLPWVKLGLLSASGTDGDGVITLILGLVAGALVLSSAKKGSGLIGCAILAIGAVIAGVAAYDFTNVSDAIKQSNNVFVSNATVGMGLYLTGLGGVALLVGGIMTMGAGESKRELSPASVGLSESKRGPDATPSAWAPTVARASHEHEWIGSEVIDPADSGDTSIRRCNVCGLIDARHEHQWGESLPSEKYSGRLYQRCKTCDKARYIDKPIAEAEAYHEHRWVAGYVKDLTNSINVTVKVCGQCGLVVELPHEHRWGDPLSSAKHEGRLYQECSACKASRYIN